MPLEHHDGPACDRVRGCGQPVLLVGADRLGRGGVQAGAPCGAVLRGWQREVDGGTVGVEQQQEVGVHGALSAWIWLGDGLAVQEDHEGAGIAVAPVELVHLGAVRGEPLDVSQFALAAMGGIAGEEATAAEYGVLLAK